MDPHPIVPRLLRKLLPKADCSPKWVQLAESQLLGPEEPGRPPVPDFQPAAWEKAPQSLYLKNTVSQ